MCCSCDELPEFKREVLEVLRQPLENGKLTLSRAAASLTYPARCTMVAAMRPHFVTNRAPANHLVQPRLSSEREPVGY
jgi:predicted ATPase with chaperone activity